MRCRGHEHGFTLYPPGFVPHSRTKIAPVGPDGDLLCQDSENKSFEGTYFDAALDACDGKPWPVQSFFGSLEPRFRTQQRHMERTAFLLGIAPEMDEKQRELIGHILSIPGQLMHDGAVAFENHNSYHIRGKAICSILDEIPLTASVFERLAQAGTVAGIWPCPRLWPNTSMPPEFHIVRTRGSPP